MEQATKQMSMEMFLPDGVKRRVRTFVDELYHEMEGERVLPCVRNRHEAYGYIVEQMNTLARSQKGVKTSVSSCESMLSGNDASFVNTANDLYDEALGMIRDAVLLAVCGQNVIYEITENLPPAPPTPLEEMAEELGELDDLLPLDDGNDMDPDDDSEEDDENA